jgi:hypothetical protein
MCIKKTEPFLPLLPDPPWEHRRILLKKYSFTRGGGCVKSFVYQVKFNVL